MKTKIAALLLTLFLVFSLTACKGNTAAPETTAQPETTTSQTQQDETEDAAENATESKDSKVLVVYFSATGTTKGVAEKIANITGADIYEIKPVQEYTDADLDWSDRSSRSTEEQNNKSVRPEIAGEKLSLDGYSTIYVGYPIWWGEEPRIMDTFAESYDFDGITMIPFCTSSSSGIGRSGKNLEENAKSGNWLEGERFNANVQDGEIQMWIHSLQNSNQNI